MKIAVLDALTLGPEFTGDVFSKFGEVSEYETTGRKEIVKRIEKTDIIVANKTVLDREALRSTKFLKLICVAATGTNNVDLDAAKDKGIIVTNVLGYSTESVVQHTFTLLFSLLGNVRYFDDYVKSGEYSKSKHFTHYGKTFLELRGKRWGIIGLGAIGGRVAAIASAFGASVKYYSTTGKHNDPVYERMALEDLLKSSDIISIHSPLNENTKNLITYESLCLMKPTAYLINVGRGGIVDEEGLVRALNEERIAGAGIDVFSQEPIPEKNPFMKLKHPEKMVLTPHIAWASWEARRRLVQEIVLNMEAYFQGEVRNRVA